MDSHSHTEKSFKHVCLFFPERQGARSCFAAGDIRTTGPLRLIAPSGRMPPYLSGEVAFPFCLS